jgi:soluble lytic murein transglycosylase-like protein
MTLSVDAQAQPKGIHVAPHVRKLAVAVEPNRGHDDRPYHTWVRRAEAAYGVSADLIHAIIKVESRYNPKAVSDAGAKGLMQLMPLTAAECGVRNVFDPVQNIFGGALYLRQLALYFRGDLVLTLAAYHAGPSAVWEAGGVPTSLRTRAYVRSVVAEYALQPRQRLAVAIPGDERSESG